MRGPGGRLGLLLLGAAVALLALAAAAAANHGGTGQQIVTDPAGDAVGGQAPRDWVRLGARSDASTLHVYVKVNAAGAPPLPTGAQITYEVGFCSLNVAYFVSPDWLTSGAWGGSNVYTAGACTAQAGGAGTTAVPTPAWECNELHIRIPRAGFQSPPDGTVLSGFYITTWDGTVTTFDFGTVGSYTLGQQGQTLQAAPAAPTVTASGDNALTVSWLSVDNGAQPVQRYHVYRQVGGSGAYVSVGSVAVPATQAAGTVVTFVDTTLPVSTAQGAGTTPTSYRYTVASENCQGTSAQGTASTALAPDFRPTAPTLAPITAVTSSSVGLSWSAATDNPAAGTGVGGYRVLRTTALPVTTSGTVVCTTGAGTTACTDNTVTAGTRHYYAVQAVDGYAAGPNQSPLSNTESALPPLPFVPPVADDLALAVAEDGVLPVALTASDGNNAPGDLAYALSGAIPPGLTGTPPALTYAPPADFCGNVSFSFRVTDPDGLWDTGQVTLAVGCVNDPPFAVAFPGPAVVEEGAPLARTLPWLDAWGVGGGADEASQVLTLDTQWTLVSGPPGLADPFADPPAVDPATGALTFTLLDADAYAVVEVVVTPAEAGGDVGAPAVRRLEILPLNDAPDLDPAWTVLEVEENTDTTGLGDFVHGHPGWSVGHGPGGTYEAVDGQSLVGFTVTGAPLGLFTTPPEVTPDGTLGFVLAPHATGTFTGTVTLADDGPGAAPHANARTVPLTIVVAPRNTPPVGEDDAGFVLVAGVPFQPLPVLANDHDFDGDPLVVAAYAAPAGHALDAAPGGFLYTPADGFDGPVTFGYAPHDGTDLGAAATVSLEVVRPVEPYVAALAPALCRGVAADVHLVAVQQGRVAVARRFDAGDGRVLSSSLASDRVVLPLAYAAAGTYPVRLEADLRSTTDPDDVATVVAEGTLEVNACNAPLAAFDVVQDGAHVRLHDRSTDDGTIATRVWDLGDGSTADGASPAHAYAAPGTYRVRLTVTDDEGATAHAERVVVVASPGGGGAPAPVAAAPDEATPADEGSAQDTPAPVNRRPQAAATAPADATVGTAVRLDASGSSDPDGDRLRHVWTQTGGPPVVLVGADTPRPSFLAPAPGRYAFRVEVHDGSLADGAHVEVFVRDRVRAAGFQTLQGEDGVAFLPGTLRPGDGPTEGTTYAWDFGDGATSDLAAPVHAYAGPGTYTVRLRTTADRQTTETVQAVHVAPAEQAPQGDGPVDLHAVQPASVPGALPTWSMAVLVAIGTVALLLLAVGAARLLGRRRT